MQSFKGKQVVHPIVNGDHIAFFLRNCFRKLGMCYDAHIPEGVCIVRAPVVQGYVREDQVLVIPDPTVALQCLEEVFCSEFVKGDKGEYLSRRSKTVPHFVIWNQLGTNVLVK